MTDLELSRALALAIGWPADDIYAVEDETEKETICIYFDDDTWRNFDYRDPLVWNLIAERYDCFPRQQRTIMYTTQASDSWYSDLQKIRSYGETPAKAVAMAVVRAQGQV